MKQNLMLPALGLAFFAAFGLPTAAQEVLPRPAQPFGGRIGLTTKDSVKDFSKDVRAPKGAPNILLILSDDVRFGASSTFGGLIVPFKFTGAIEKVLIRLSQAELSPQQQQELDKQEGANELVD